MHDISRSAAIESALSEAKVACMLSHPNIVGVYDFGSDENCAYLIMEYIDGLNLLQILEHAENGHLDLDACAGLADSIGSALSYAHENGVLHLDIKPTNIMVDTKGIVKLCDFGVAELTSIHGYDEARGGTLGYMSLEQLRGRAVDERSDIFSLAVVLWQALTGINPFLAGSPETATEKVLQGPAQSLRAFRDNPDDEGLEELLRRALAPNPSFRPESMDDFIAELSLYLGSPRLGAHRLQEIVLGNLSGATDPDLDDTSSDLAEAVDLSDRFGWLEGVITRILSAVLAFLALRELLGFVPELDTKGIYLTALIVSTAAALWPPLTSLTTGAVLTGICIRAGAGSVFSCIAATILAAVLLIWWIVVAKNEHLASGALLLPFCSGFPGAGAGLSGFCLDPAEACVSAAGSCLLGLFMLSATSQGFDVSQTFALCAKELMNPAFWIICAGSSFWALISSVIALRGSVKDGIAGQVAGLVVFFAAVIGASLVENQELWGAQSGELCAFALVFCIAMCIMCMLRGALSKTREG